MCNDPAVPGSPRLDAETGTCARDERRPARAFAKRAVRVGPGCVSFFDTEAVGDLLEMPTASCPIAIPCLGPVAEFPPQPVLESKAWRSRLPLDEVLFEDRWRAGAGGTSTAY